MSHRIIAFFILLDFYQQIFKVRIDYYSLFMGIEYFIKLQFKEKKCVDR